MIEFTSRKLTQEAAELYKKRHDDLINNMPDVIMVFDREHRHLYVNPAVLEQTGIEPEKFIGKTHAEMGFPKGICDFLEEAIEKGKFRATIGKDAAIMDKLARLSPKKAAETIAKQMGDLLG